MLGLEVFESSSASLFGGEKKLSVRDFALPSEYANRNVVLLARPSNSPLPDALPAGAGGFSVLGVVQLSGGTAPYENRQAFESDVSRHQVPPGSEVHRKYAGESGGAWPGPLGDVYAWSIDSAEPKPEWHARFQGGATPAITRRHKSFFTVEMPSGADGLGAATVASTITYPAKPPAGRHSGRLMEPSIWPRIAPIWPSSTHFPHPVDSLHEEDDTRLVDVEDGRTCAEPPTLDSHGFELCRSPCVATDLDDAAQLEAYLAQTARLVQRATRADLVVPFHHVRIDTARDRFGKRGGAVERVHGDYTAASGPQMLQELGECGVLPPRARTMRRGAILNVWRNVSSEAVRSKPLALCHVGSVAPDDVGVYYLVEGGEGRAERRMGMNLSLHYSPAHRWSYFPRMTRDEALVFYTYDGRADEPRFTFHAAFDPLPDTAPDAPPRVAMIVRCAALFE